MTPADENRKFTEELLAEVRALRSLVETYERETAGHRRVAEELRESKERYKGFVRNSSEAIWRMEFDEPISTALGEDEQIADFYRHGYLAECNNLMARMYGFASPAEIEGARAADLLAQDDPQNIAYLRLFIRSNYRLTDAESKELDREGRTKYFLNNMIGVVEGGHVLRAWGTQRDITERRQLEEQLRQSQKLEAVGKLASGVAHDFNNLLTAITGYCELSLRKLGEGEPLRRNIEEIRKAGERATALTGQLLAFSRKQVLTPTVLDLHAVVEDMEKMLRRLIGEDIELEIFSEPDLTRIKADRGQVQQVLMNLAVNARDAMPAGGKLTVETSNVWLSAEYASRHFSLKPGRYVLLAVSDTGCGIEKEILPHIFEPFFTTKEIGKGTGLGLSTVYGVVRQSGGDVWVYSEPGLGTTFRVYLPLVEGETEAPAPREDPAEEAPPLAGCGTVLLVEDEEMVRSMCREVLETSGYQVLEAPNGEDALRVCRDHGGALDLVLTDIIMPTMNGPRMAEELKQMCPQVPVLYMSGYTDKLIAHRGILASEIEFLQKPFSPDDLVIRVRTLIEEGAA